MAKYGSYLVCKDHLADVEAFLGNFFERVDTKYNHSEWITFKVPHGDFLINLMKGENQDVTQNVIFELYCDSKEELEQLAAKYSFEVKSILATSAPQKYRYYFGEIPGPANICKIEISFSEDIDS